MGEIRHLPVKLRALREESIEPEALNPGLFTISFNNRKKQGKQGLQSHMSQGVLYHSGHVNLDTPLLQVTTFLSIKQMVDYLEEFGDCAIIEGETV